MSAALKPRLANSVSDDRLWRIIGLDLETTGLSQPKGDRIIEIAMVEMLYRPSTHKAAVKSSFVRRSNPERMVDPGAEAVHGISWAMVQDEPLWPELAPAIRDFLGQPDLLVMHNANFDGPFIAGELLRMGIAPPDCDTFCTMLPARWATATGKLPKLRELCFSLGIEYDEAKAHGAEYDARLTLQCLVRGLKKGFYTLPEVTR